MEILIGLVLALGLLWAWLAGHWFARVVAFLAFATLFGFGGAVLFANGMPGVTTAGISLGAIGGVVLAWPVAGIPTYIQRAAMAA
jgi:hypothetical protein